MRHFIEHLLCVDPIVLQEPLERRPLRATKSSRRVRLLVRPASRSSSRSRPCELAPRSSRSRAPASCAPCRPTPPPRSHSRAPPTSSAAATELHAANTDHRRRSVHRDAAARKWAEDVPSTARAGTGAAMASISTAAAPPAAVHSTPARAPPWRPRGLAPPLPPLARAGGEHAQEISCSRSGAGPVLLCLP